MPAVGSLWIGRKRVDDLAAFAQSSLPFSRPKLSDKNGDGLLVGEAVRNKHIQSFGDTRNHRLSPAGLDNRRNAEGGGVGQCLPSHPTPEASPPPARPMTALPAASLAGRVVGGVGA
jgi:hypothetical protein